MAAQEVIEKATVDCGCIKFFVGQMIWAVEHDLADGRGMALKAINSLIQVSGVFDSAEYLKKIHKNTPKEELDRMKKLSDEIKNLMGKAVYECI